MVIVKEAERRHLPDRLIGADKLPEGQWASVLGLSMWAAGDDGGPDDDEDGNGNGGLLNRLRDIFRGPGNDDNDDPAMAAEA